jgi:hypothetical protein
MPSPTPPREVRCEACGSRVPHSPENPIPNPYPFDRSIPVAERVKAALHSYGSVLPGCVGCWPPGTDY